RCRSAEITGGSAAGDAGEEAGFAVVFPVLGRLLIGRVDDELVDGFGGGGSHWLFVALASGRRVLGADSECEGKDAGETPALPKPALQKAAVPKPALEELLTHGQFFRPAFLGFCSMYLANLRRWDALRTK